MSSVVLDIVYHVTWYLLVARGYRSVLAQVPERLIFPKLLQFGMLGVLPLGITFALIDHYSLFMIPGYLIAILVSRFVPKVLESHLVNQASQNLLSLRVSLEVFESRLIQEVVLLCIHRDGNGIAFDCRSQLVPGCSARTPSDENIPSTFRMSVLLVVGNLHDLKEAVLKSVLVTPVEHSVVRHDLLEAFVPCFAFETQQRFCSVGCTVLE